MINTNIFSNIDLEPELSPMKTGEAQGWPGMKYKWVSLPVTEQNKNLDRVGPPNEWCLTQFGKSGARWFEQKGKFFFRDEKDMTMFLLRWS
jgi:hypothetical protein